jgi:tetratricopeptide (TPR) repeat protein
MRSLSRSSIAILAIALAVTLALPAVSQGQEQKKGKVAIPPDQADYNTWNAIKDPAKKIQAGEAYVVKYPTSQYSVVVYDQLVKAYYDNQDWNNFYGDADKALAKSPDDVNILTLVGWVIPHQYNPDDPDAGKKLDRATTYEQHAIDVIASMPKPATLTDEQFAADKAQLLSQAHSGLGLIYFRKEDYDNTVRELLQATQGEGSPDPTDAYVLGVSLEKLNRYSEAADAFQKCSATPGPLQGRCKQSADQDKAKAPTAAK